MNVETKVVESQHYGYVQNHKPYGEHVKGESAFLEAFKERRSHLQPHAIYKEHETEVLHEVEYFHGAGVCAFGHTGFVYVPHEYSREQPSDIPPTLIFPSITPAAITMAKTITMCATELMSENKL